MAQTHMRFHFSVPPNTSNRSEVPNPIRERTTAVATNLTFQCREAFEHLLSPWEQSSQARRGTADAQNKAPVFRLAASTTQFPILSRGMLLMLCQRSRPRQTTNILICSLYPQHCQTSKQYVVQPLQQHHYSRHSQMLPSFPQTARELGQE